MQRMNAAPKPVDANCILAHRHMQARIVQPMGIIVICMAIIIIHVTNGAPLTHTPARLRVGNWVHPSAALSNIKIIPL